ncbi:nucleotidyltransferase family protein [Bacillus xiapuensis]|uniref:nucleotidyltransferase family protein n=1 Tax=Bacillus xiapuensis TaxID=2014075 RepID=UPI000C23C5CD|nr:nucleotidyltransferase family protein [Bacillus xiapuensis]
MKGVILAGGKGERLKPFTNSLPKPMIPLLNKPLLEYNLELLKKQGIYEVILTVCYKKETIIEYFGDGSRFGMHLSYIEEKDPLGTAGSLFRHRELFQEPAVVISGDSLTNLSLEQAIRFHNANQALFTLAAVEKKSVEGLGICLTDDSGRLIDFCEKPSKEHIFSYLVNTGIYIIEPELFQRYPFFGKVDFAKELFPLLMKDHQRIFVYQTDAYWQDVGTPFQYWMAERHLRKGIPGVRTPVQPALLPAGGFYSHFFQRFHLAYTLSSNCPSAQSRQRLLKTHEQ